MDFDQEESLFPLGAIVYGCLAALFAVLILVVFSGVLTELGWMGTISWPNNSLFLIILYTAVIIGSIMAGWRSRQKGWIVGLSIGILSSILLLIFSAFTNQSIHGGAFLFKTFINSFIGVFGGIIGVNISGNKG